MRDEGRARRIACAARIGERRTQADGTGDPRGDDRGAGTCWMPRPEGRESGPAALRARARRQRAREARRRSGDFTSAAVPPVWPFRGQNAAIFCKISPAPILKFRVMNAVNALEGSSHPCHDSLTDIRTDTMQIDFSTTTRSPLADGSLSANASSGAAATSATPAATTSTDGATDATGASSTTNTTGTGGTKGSTGASGETSGASGASSDSPAVAQLKALIDRLQKQLATIERQMASAGQRAKDDPAAAIEQQSLSAEAGAISGALSTAISQLAAAIEKEGGSQAGGLVSTQA
jgi:hypothetical protein